MNIEQTKTLVTDLLVRYELYGQGWRFVLSRGKSLLGSCNYRQKQIKVSRYLIERGTDAEVRDTVLHEIAHALVGGKVGHNWIWRAKCREIGAKPERLAHAVSYTVPHKIELECVTHGTIDKRHRKLKAGMLARLWCLKCGPAHKGLLTQVILEGATV